MGDAQGILAGASSCGSGKLRAALTITKSTEFLPLGLDHQACPKGVKAPVIPLL